MDVARKSNKKKKIKRSRKGKTMGTIERSMVARGSRGEEVEEAEHRDFSGSETTL